MDPATTQSPPQPDEKKELDAYDIDDKDEKAALIRDRLAAVTDDIRWREDELNIEADECAELFEEASDGTTPRTAAPARQSAIERQYAVAGIEGIEKRLPRFNMLRRAISERVSVSLANLPDAPLRADYSEGPSGDLIEERLRAMAKRKTEETANAWVDTKCRESGYDLQRADAIRGSGIYGYGFLVIDVDRAKDVRYNSVVAHLVRKARRGEEWTRADHDAWAMAGKRVAARWVDSRYCFVGRGTRRAMGDTFTRFSTVEPKRTKSLRDTYDNQDIRPCRDPWNIETPEDAVDDVLDNDDTTALVTTWELIPRQMKVDVPGTEVPLAADDEEAGPAGATYTGAVLVKTVIAGGQLLEYLVLEDHEAPMEIPAVAWIFEESPTQPYGISQVRDLRASEEFINRIKVMLYRAALRSSRPGAVAIWTKKLGDTDRAQIQNAMRNGGAAFLEGNSISGSVTDIRQIVMPLGFAAAPPDPALIHAMNTELGMFRVSSQMPDEKAMQASRTGAGKRAQMSHADRLVRNAVVSFARSEKRAREMFWRWIQVLAPDPVHVSVDMPGGRSRTEVLNQVWERSGVPRVDFTGELVRDSSGALVTRTVRVVINDTSLLMTAHPDPRGDYPADPVLRRQVIAYDKEQGLITDKTARQLALDPETRKLDDFYRDEADGLFSMPDTTDPTGLLTALGMGGAPGQQPAVLSQQNGTQPAGGGPQTTGMMGLGDMGPGGGGM